MKCLTVTFLWSSYFLMSLSVWASDGVLDTIFHSPDGYVLWDGGSGYDRGRDIALQQDGKILVTGYMTNGTDDDIMVIRYNRDGTLDAGFGTNGAYIYDGGNDSDGGYAIAVQSDNKILLAGASVYYPRLAPSEDRQYLVGKSCPCSHKRHRWGIDNSFIHGGGNWIFTGYPGMLS